MAEAPQQRPLSLPREGLLEHRAFVRALARDLVLGADADDVAQEALLAGVESAPRSFNAWRAWLRTTVRNVACNLLRGRTRRERREKAVARRETLPSAATLVERLEIEQRLVEAVLRLPEPERAVVVLRFYEDLAPAEIARRSCLQPDTVRARLRRALERLHAELDADHGGREQWVPGILAILSQDPAVPIPSPPPLGASIAMGATMMSMKTAATLAAAGLIAAGSIFILPDAFQRMKRTITPIFVASAGASPPLTPQAPETQAEDPVSARRDSIEDDPSSEKPANPPADLPPPGTVTFHVVGAEQGNELDAVTIRLLNERRFACYEGPGNGSVRLTAGSWSARVESRGREPVVLDSFVVLENSPSDLGWIPLARGAGTIAGRVSALHLTGDGEVIVELFGGGRGPCDQCEARALALAQLEESIKLATEEELARLEAHPSASPGSCCGFYEASSAIALKGGGEFEFRNLAQGGYWLRAYEPSTKLVDTRRVDVARHGQEFVELDVSLPVFAEVVLRHDRGAAFLGDWESPHRESPALIQFDVKLAERARATGRFHPSVESVRRSIGPPLHLDAVEANRSDLSPVCDYYVRSSVQTATIVSLSQIHYTFANEVILDQVGLEGVWMSEGADRLDRERTADDALALEAGAPSLEGVELEVKEKEPGWFVVGPLPRSLLSLEVSCGNYVSEAISIDLRYGEPQPELITMHLLASVEEVLRLGPPASCRTCHDAQALRASRPFADYVDLDVDLDGAFLLNAVEMAPAAGQDGDQ